MDLVRFQFLMFRTLEIAKQTQPVLVASWSGLQKINQDFLSKIDKVFVFGFSEKSLTEKEIKLMSEKDIVKYNENYLSLSSWQECERIKKTPLAAKIAFDNGSNYVFSYGKIGKKIIKWEQAHSDVSIVFQENNWLEDYDGRFGYIVTSGAEEPVKYFPYGIAINYDMPILLHVDKSGVTVADWY